MATKKTTKTDDSTDLFERFRARANEKVSKSSGGKLVAVTDDPYILGEEEGFDPEISIPKPDFTTRIALTDASRNNDMIRILRLLFGNDVNRLIGTINEIAPDDGEEILGGILTDILTHFYGPGAMTAGFTGLSI